MTEPEPEETPKPRRKSWIAFAKEASVLAIMIAGSFAARSSLADHYYVPSGSMIPTVEIGDRVLVNKIAYGVRVPFTRVTMIPAAGPARGDVVVLDSPEDGRTLLKRVVALPGDVVQVRAGHVFVNGEIEGVHPLGLEQGGGPDFGPVTLKPDRYLVLGDHRGNSLDGRYFGPVARRAILGKAERVFLRDGHFVWRSL